MTDHEGPCGKYCAVVDECEARGKRIAELEAQVAGWQPIETAPKDGTEIILSGGELRDEVGSPGFGGEYLCYWSERDGGIWRIRAGFGEIAEVIFPTHWHAAPTRE